MNFLLAFAFSAKRIAKVDIIFESAKFIFKIFDFFFLRDSLFNDLSSHLRVFCEADCKGRHYF